MSHSFLIRENSVDSKQQNWDQLASSFKTVSVRQYDCFNLSRNYAIG